MKHLILLLALAAASLGASAQEWISVASGKNDEYYVLKGSYELRKNRSGEEIAVVTGKNDDRAARQINLEKWYVRTEDCLRKQGKMVTLNMDGNFKYEFDFIFGAGSVGSAKAEFVCAVYLYQTMERDKKGL